MKNNSNCKYEEKNYGAKNKYGSFSCLECVRCGGYDWNIENLSYEEIKDLFYFVVIYTIKFSDQRLLRSLSKNLFNKGMLEKKMVDDNLSIILENDYEAFDVVDCLSAYLDMIKPRIALSIYNKYSCDARFERNNILTGIKKILIQSELRSARQLGIPGGKGQKINSTKESRHCFCCNGYGKTEIFDHEPAASYISTGEYSTCGTCLGSGYLFSKISTWKCICEGINSNCYYCRGKGFIKEHISL